MKVRLVEELRQRAIDAVVRGRVWACLHALQNKRNAQGAPFYID